VCRCSAVSAMPLHAESVFCQPLRLHAGDEAGVNIELSSVVIIGRRDYVLRAVHPQASVHHDV
jgi:hypothetical protein